nr:15-cis-zeta-carotene isomerase, chloroplastic [Tanacetum cinerariifolium]
MRLRGVSLAPNSCSIYRRGWDFSCGKWQAKSCINNYHQNDFGVTAGELVGHVMWCLAHTIWIGNSVAVAASVGLIGHHLFGAWNGDRRLRIRYGEAFDIVKSRTSVLPFAAILDGRQKLSKDYYKEFIRLPYLVITGLTLGAYFAHPLMQAASLSLHW